MEFGLLYEWQMPAGISRDEESRHFLQMIEQVKLAEELGFTSVWSVEHHFLESFSHASAPEVLLSWIAAQTSTIRVGHGVRLLPYPYNHPIRAAEQAATLDLLSRGRLEFGTGRSATAAELGGFGIDPAQTRDMWRESLELILKAYKAEKTAGLRVFHGKKAGRMVVLVDDAAAIARAFGRGAVEADIQRLGVDLADVIVLEF